MKQQGMLALVLILFTTASGAATSATARSARTLQSSDNTLAEAEVDAFHGAAFLDRSESDTEVKTALLDRLSKAEALTATERQALRAQQQVLIAMEQEQEILESRVNALEANERVLSSAGVVVEKGTVSNSAAQTPIVRQEAEHPRIYKVAMNKQKKSDAGAESSKSNHAFVILMRESERQFWDKYNKAFWEKMTGIACYIVQIFIVAFLYMQFCKQKVTPKLPESMVRTDEFQFGAFDASDLARDCQMCVCAACCPWIRWAESASKEHIQFLAFAPALFMTALLASSSTVTFGASMAILLLIVVLCRQRIRDTYGLPSGTCGILCGDCLLWICCPCCAIVQEARQVEYVEIPMQEYGSGPPMGP